MRQVFLSILLVVVALSIKGQTHPFKAGESLRYGIYYYLMGVWVGAGEVTFSVHDDIFLGKDCYRFKGYGTTYSRYDWFFQVRDTYESYASKKDLRPFRFKRDVSEGGFYFYEDNLYNYRDSVIYSVLKVKENPVELDTFDVLRNSFDVLSLVYASRNIDFAHKEIGEKIPIRMVVDQEIFELHIRFLGTDTYDHDDLGEVECYVFAPLLVEGTIFKAGERMKVWVTKDRNLIPIYIESQIRVGSIRSELKEYHGLKFPLGS
ncbi:MAG: DUF3108 domain-containing protein [Flavobacteriales bacterium]|nr:DUF3108 domain-containing protein [Flavobacteriales bacterium]